MSTAALTKALERYLGDRCSPQVAAQCAPDEVNRPLWDEMEELDFTTVAVAEENGGAGGDSAELVTLVKTAGRYALPLPLAEKPMLAGWLIERAGLTLPAGPAIGIAGDPATPLRISADGRVSGTVSRVRWAPLAETFVALVRDDSGAAQVVLLEPGACTLTRRPSLGNEPVADVSLDGVSVTADAMGPAPDWVDETEFRCRGALMRSIAVIGALGRIQELTVTYAQQREQFGKPIARFQAVQGLVAELARDVAMADAAVNLAASSLRPDAPLDPLAVAVARSVSNRSVTSVARRGHEVHGAMGVTTDYPLHLYTTRSRSWREDFGDAGYWDRRAGELARLQPDGLWELITTLHTGFEQHG
jgi:acyl-CoA dehydrogenase